MCRVFLSLEQMSSIDVERSLIEAKVVVLGSQGKVHIFLACFATFCVLLCSYWIRVPALDDSESFLAGVTSRLVVGAHMPGNCCFSHFYPHIFLLCGLCNEKLT